MDEAQRRFVSPAGAKGYRRHRQAGTERLSLCAARVQQSAAAPASAALCWQYSRRRDVPAADVRWRWRCTSARCFSAARRDASRGMPRYMPRFRPLSFRLPPFFSRVISSLPYDRGRFRPSLLPSAAYFSVFDINIDAAFVLKSFFRLFAALRQIRHCRLIFNIAAGWLMICFSAFRRRRAICRQLSVMPLSSRFTAFAVARRRHYFQADDVSLSPFTPAFRRHATRRRLYPRLPARPLMLQILSCLLSD